MDNWLDTFAQGWDFLWSGSVRTWDMLGQMPYGQISAVGMCGMLTLTFIVYLMLGRKPMYESNAEARRAYQMPVIFPKVGKPGLFERKRYVEPIALAGIKIETWMKHVAIGATTGARKTTIMAYLIMQANRPVVFIAGDKSPYAIEAMRARGWRVWHPDGRYGGLYVFEGDPNECAQLVTVLFKRSQGDTGLQRGIAQRVFRECIEDLDKQGIPRSWPALREALLTAKSPDGLVSTNFNRAKVNWLSRLDNLTGALGSGLGDDISILDCLRSECGLAFDLNAFSDVEYAQDFGELAVRLTQFAADKTGDFWWFIDELALFNKELIGQIIRTCRIRLVKFVGASQVISDFGEVLKGLVKIWFVGEQTQADYESRVWCERLTDGLVPQENFAEHATPPGFYYVVADGRTQWVQVNPWPHPRPMPYQKVYDWRKRRDRSKLRGQARDAAGPTVKSVDFVPQPTPSAVGPAATPSRPSDDGAGDGPSASGLDLLDPALCAPAVAAQLGSPSSAPSAAPTPLTEQPQTLAGPRRLQLLENPPDPIANDDNLLRMWSNCKRTSKPAALWHPDKGLYWDTKGCLVYHPPKGKRNLNRRPKSNIGRSSVTVYVEIFRAMRGNPPPELPSLDHLCGNRWCVDWTHIDPTTVTDNNQREPLRNAAFKGANYDWTVQLAA